MRMTFGSIAALTAGILVTIALWPEPELGDVPPQAGAQQNPFSLEDGDYMSGGAQPEKQRSSKADATQAKVENNLQQPLLVEFDGVPLAEALQSISDEIEVDILINGKGLATEGVSPKEDTLILQLKYTEVSAKTALELILEPFNLGYRIREGFLYVEPESELEEALEVRVYNCRDLLEGVEVPAPPRPGGGLGGGFGGGGEGGGFFSVGDPAGQNRRESSLTLFQFGDGGFGGGGCSRPRPTTPAGVLIEVIQNETSGTWENEGGSGTIDPFNGLLVVRQTQQVHREIEQLLEMLREADRQDRDAQEENSAPVEEEVSAFGESEAPRSTNPLRKPRESTPFRKSTTPAAPEKK